MPKPTTIAALRTLVAAWTPAPIARSADGIATGVASIDAALGGGLARGKITELVSAVPSAGGELVFGALLASTRAARLRVALIDAGDGFVPANHAPDLLRHLVWVRAHSLAEAISCADVVVRDGNYAVMVLDVRGVPPPALRQQPVHAWHRLRLSAEQSPSAVLVQSLQGFLPAVPWRLALRSGGTLLALRETRGRRLSALAVEVERGHIGQREELTG